MNIVGIMGPAGVGKDTMADHLVQYFDSTKVALADPLKRICRDVYNFSEQQLWGPSAERNKPDRRYSRDYGWVCDKCMHTFHAGEDVESKSLGTIDGRCAYCAASQPLKLNRIVTYLTPRLALQTLGTEWGREMYVNTWVDLAIRNAKQVLAGRPYTQMHGLQLIDIAMRCRAVVIPDVRFKNEVDAIQSGGGMVVRIRRKLDTAAGGIAGHASEEEQKSIPDSALKGGVIEAPFGLPQYHAEIDSWAKAHLGA